MYSIFSPNSNNFCDYRDRFIQTFPNVSLNQFNDVLFTQNGFTGCNN